MKFWSHDIGDTVIFRPLCASPLWSLVGKLCTITARHEGMVRDGVRIASFGGVYDVEFATGEVLCVWEHDLIEPGVRRWMH